jgi:hypothetical protein
MGSKMFSLRDNRLKSSTRDKRNRVEFFDETYKNKKEVGTIYKNSQNFGPPVQYTDNPMKSKEFRS